MDSAKSALNCDSERCVLRELTDVIGAEKVRYEILVNLKVTGPTNAKLLTDINIDQTLQQWAIKYTDFYPYNFNMRNYASYSYRDNEVIDGPDTLATILFQTLYDGTHNGTKYKCAGCVINSDIYQGPGKHWMAIFADARTVPWTIEFFNSSGNSPAPEWVSWMEKTKISMELAWEKCEKSAPKIETKKVTSIRHQQSRSECGMYSLFYIWARVNNIPADYFNITPIPDQLMFEFRQHLFNDPTRKTMKSFDWVKYKNTATIKWSD
jgi:hypothetical protein